MTLRPVAIVSTRPDARPINIVKPVTSPNLGA